IKREQVNPDQIDQVPVEADQIDRCVILIRKFTAIGADGDPGEQEDSDENVESVQAGHHEIEREESPVAVAYVSGGIANCVGRLRMIPAWRKQVLFELVRILEILDG